MSLEATSLKILQAAGKIFAEKGFKGATIRDICSKAEVNVASVNYHFGDKQRLYIETFRYAHESNWSQFPMPNWNEETSDEQKLYDFIFVMLSRMQGKEQWQMKLLMQEIAQPTKAVQELVEQNIRPHFQLLLNILNSLCDRTITEPKLTQVGFSVIGQCMFYHFNRSVIDLLVDQSTLDKHFQLTDLANHITQFTLSAISNYPENTQLNKSNFLMNPGMEATKLNNPTADLAEN